MGKGAGAGVGLEPLGCQVRGQAGRQAGRQAETGAD